MSTMRTPVGPQPPKVYWRRRLMVALGLLAIIVIVVLIVVRPGASEEGTPAADPSASPTTSPAGDPAGDEESDAAEDGTCRPQNVTIEAVTDKDAYAATELPQVSMRLTNIGSSPCILDVTPTSQLFEVGSGPDVYWLSSDCQVEAQPLQVTLEPNVAQATTPIPWDRTRSLPCDASVDPVPAGDATYYLKVALGELESQQKPFRLL